MADEAAIPDTSTLDDGERLSDETFRRLLDLIYDGTLAPGDRLPSERDLSERLGVSRTTLRDSLNRLEARGFIQRRPKSGTYICTSIPKTLRTSIEEVVDSRVIGFREILEVRKALELWAVSEAARNADKASLGALNDVLQTMKRNAKLASDVEFERYSEADLQFHRVLAEMTQNALYIHLYHFLVNLVLRSISMSREIVADDFGHENLLRHKAIYDALKKSDREKARNAMVEHFAYVEERLEAN